MGYEGLVTYFNSVGKTRALKKDITFQIDFLAIF